MDNTNSESSPGKWNSRCIPESSLCGGGVHVGGPSKMNKAIIFAEGVSCKLSGPCRTSIIIPPFPIFFSSKINYFPTHVQSQKHSLSSKAILLPNPFFHPCSKNWPPWTQERELYRCWGACGGPLGADEGYSKRKWNTRINGIMWNLDGSSMIIMI